MTELPALLLPSRLGDLRSITMVHAAVHTAVISPSYVERFYLWTLDSLHRLALKREKAGTWDSYTAGTLAKTNGEMPGIFHTIRPESTFSHQCSTF